MRNENVVVICPPCGENVALATKRGSLNKEIFFTTLLPRLTAVLPPQGREITTRGFTLIELLVVVLIICILAAVAVPQYQFAVLKTRMQGILPLMKSIKESDERYYLENGEYTEDLSLLDIEVPLGEVQNNPVFGFACYKNGTCFDNLLMRSNPYYWVIVGGIGSSSQGDSDDSCFISLWLDHSKYPGRIECGKSRSTHPQCARLCKSMGYE